MISFCHPVAFPFRMYSIISYHSSNDAEGDDSFIVAVMHVVVQ